MASIVAYIEVREGAITPPSLFVVSESRRIAQAAGATVYAFLPIGKVSHEQIERLARQITAAGADRVLCSSDATLAGPPLDVTHGAVLAQLAEHLRPLLLLLPGGGVGADLGPPLSIRMGAAYVPAASVEVHTRERPPEPLSQRILVTRWRAAGDGVRRIDVGDLERPVVAVLQTGPAAVGDLGESYADVETLPCPTARHSEFQLLRAEPDTNASIEWCADLVCVPAETVEADADTLRESLPAGDCLRVETDRDVPRAAPRVLVWMGLERALPPVRASVIVDVAATAAELATALRHQRQSKAESST